MANVDRTRGLIPVNNMGVPTNHAVIMCYTIATDGTAYGIGDIVKADGTAGLVGVRVNGVPVEGMLEVIKHGGTTVGQDIVGVVVGFVPDPATAMVGQKHRLASTARICYVVPAVPTQLFEITEDADTTPVAATGVGSNFALIAGSVSATTGYSGTQLDSSSVNTTATLPLRLVGLVPAVDNAFNTGGSGTDKARLLVQFNTSIWMPNIASV